MEKFLVSAATGAMTSLLGKMGTMLTHEYKLLKDVRGDIEFLKDELEAMQAFLLMMADVEEPDHQARLRADAVRELSYDIEDKIYKFMILVNHKSSSKSEIFKELFSKSMKKIADIKTRHKIAKDVKNIKSKVKEISKRYARYKIDEPSMPRNEKVDPRLCAVYKDASELVGIDALRDELVKLLTDEDGEFTNQLKVVSIVGTGGLGKTSLVRQVYNKLGANFDCKAFVSISRSPDMSKILSSILSQLRNQDQNHAGIGDPELIDHIREFLKDKRYLIVIDDVWDVPTWRILECAFDKGSCGSRVMSTTRNNDVAKSCCSSDLNLVYKIKPLGDSDSAKLFFKRIFGCEERCPSNLKEASEDILKKCGGLPLAINAISSLLAAGERNTEQECNRVRRSIISAEGKCSDIEAMKYILSLSYFDLPLHLRSCLLYLTMFPEDYEVRRKRLVHRWISEGFIRGKDGEDLVELVDMYLHDLVNRSLIQPVKVKYNCKVLSCRVHDTILDFLIDLSDRENFSTLLRNKAKLDRRIRRISLIGNEDQGIIEQLDISHARSLGVFGRTNQLPSLVKSDALRVLDLEDCKELGNHHVKDIGGLVQLRYLNIVLTDITKLPESLCRLKCLAHLSVGPDIKLPDEIGNMAYLQELGYINLFEQSLNFAEELGKLINLRKLKVTWMTSESDSASYKEKLVSSLCKLDKCNLRDLRISFWLKEEDGFIRDLCFPSLNCIRSINLYHGEIRWIAKWLLSLANLQKLKIIEVKIEQQDVDMIGSISTLVEFELRSVPEGIIIIVGGFQRLQKFSFTGYNGLVFENGAVPNLMELELTTVFLSVLKCSASDYCFGIQHLASLAIIDVCIYSSDVEAADVEALERALKSMVEANPNHPALEMAKVYAKGW